MTQAPEAPALSYRQLSVTFSTDAGPVRAVDDVTFDVKPGEVLAVVGESGSGKSVSSRAAIGLLPDTARVTGTVLLGDRDVAGLSDKQFTALRGKDIAMVFQEPGAALDPLFTVGYQISEAIRAHTDVDRKQARDKAIDLLRLVRLPDPEQRYGFYPHQLSGGQKQRVVIACAIACDPEVILADEPTTALDVTVQAEILELLRDLRDRLGSAIVLITHNMGVVADLADRVVVMNAGKVVEIATVAKLFAEPSQDYTRTLLAAVPHLGQGNPEHQAGAETKTENVLEIDRLSVEFPGAIGSAAFKAVDDVTFSIDRGKTLGLVGRVGLGQVHDRALRCGAAEADDRYGQDSRPGHHRHDREAAPAGAREVRLRVPGPGDLAESASARGRLRRRAAEGAQGDARRGVHGPRCQAARRGAAAQGHRRALSA